LSSAFALAALLLAAALAAAVPRRAEATVLVPTRDDEVVEILPAVSGDRAELRRLRQQQAADPRAVEGAVALARRYLEEARRQGDPRYAGLAFAALAAWPAPASAPDEVLLLQATLQQFVHDFETAATHLERLVQRSPGNAQAWLTLATVRRVQGRYADSDRACAGLLAVRAGPSAIYGRACQAENDSLRGEFQQARDSVTGLLGGARLAGPTRNWLLTTLAESEARAGRPVQAEAAYEEAQAAQPDGYTALSYADFLLEGNRPAAALAQLQGQPRTDAVLLRLAIAGTQLDSAQARRDVAELRQRMALANLRPEARTTHAREGAMFALWIDRSPRRALALAREDVKHQREPLDILVLAHAAAASQDAAALREAASLVQDLGLRDQRVDALL
jgi:tetratricopeptide (TPR) repeat protein